MTDEERAALHEALTSIQGLLNGILDRLTTAEADLAEIKARLVHASPGYDMRPEVKASIDEYEARMAGEQEDGP